MRAVGGWGWVLGLALVTAQGGVFNLDDTGQPLRWDLVGLPSFVPTNVVNRQTRAVRFFLASDAYSVTNRQAELDAVRASFGQWQSPPGTLLRFEDAGLVSPGVDINTSDHTNLVFWAKNSTLINGGLDDLSGTLGYAYYSFRDGTLLEADIVLNGHDFSWFTDPAHPVKGSYLVEAVALHEIGHFIGLDHSPIGGATLFPRGGTGLTSQAGLAADEVSALLYLYPLPGRLQTLGVLQGSVTLNGQAVFGAVVVAEDSHGNVQAGTLTQPDGTYSMPALPPGQYQVRVTPLDDPGSDPLISRYDFAPVYWDATSTFLPSPATLSTVGAGLTATCNVAVDAGQPAFHISRLRVPSNDIYSWTIINSPISLPLGATQWTVGAYSTDFPSSQITLELTGDGLTVGSSSLNGSLVTALVSMATNATPGLRSLSVRHGQSVAWANGFLEIMPPFPDFNFDGLDDNFQRAYFSPFTRPEAAPDADPDGDGFNNRAEFLAGTNPTNATSFLRIEGVSWTHSGLVWNWRTLPGKHFQVWTRTDLKTDAWQPLGPAVTATNTLAQFAAPASANIIRFYRLEAIP